MREEFPKTTTLVDGRTFLEFSGEEGQYLLLNEWYKDHPNDHEGALWWIGSIAAGGQTVWPVLYNFFGEPFTTEDVEQAYCTLKPMVREGLREYREGGGELFDTLRNAEHLFDFRERRANFRATALAYALWVLAGSIYEYQ